MQQQQQRSMQRPPHPALLTDLAHGLKSHLAWLTPAEQATLLHSLVCVCVFAACVCVCAVLCCVCAVCVLCVCAVCAVCVCV